MIPLVATFSETNSLSSKKYVPETGKSIPDLQEKIRDFWSKSSIHVLENQC